MEQRKQLRLAQLYITDEIVRICEKHNIRYWLDCGTMLGAVRHHGFIPWDDDIDLGMLKEDYDHFLSIVPSELCEEFFLDNYETNPENGLVFSKIRLKGTKYLEEKANQSMIHNEIFVDIFPYFPISDNLNRRRIDGMIMSLLAQAIMSKSGYKNWKGETYIKRLKFIPTDIIGLMVSKKNLHKLVDIYYYRYSATKCVCIHDGMGYRCWFMPKEIFDEFIDVQFENHVYKIPKDYDSYLKIGYGDYMTIPSEEKQITHMVKELNFGDYYFE